MNTRKIILYCSAILFAFVVFSCTQKDTSKIDRYALVERNNPVINNVDSLASLTVGNGEFAYTVDVTGLQTFPRFYSNGVPLGTQSQWGWHSFPNAENYSHDETLKNYDFGRGRLEPYSVQFKDSGRQQDASNWYRINPHRLHLGIVGLETSDEKPSDIIDIHQTLDMWRGVIISDYKIKGEQYHVETVCNPETDCISAKIISNQHRGICFRFPYPTGAHADDACDWNANEKHSTEIVSNDAHFVTLKRTVDSTIYYVNVSWEDSAVFIEKENNYFVLLPQKDTMSFNFTFLKNVSDIGLQKFAQALSASEQYWKKYWTEGAAVDFSHCTDPRAAELERRVVLSQYLLAVQCAGFAPPQETGLTYNSWYGKFHLEMIWWHEAQFALWGHSALLERTMPWYEKVAPIAHEIAKRQGFDGLRWMKMTDPSGVEAPSGVGSFLIWQQPHYIYLLELIYRSNPTKKTLQKYYPLVQETACFMYSFADYDSIRNRYVLKGIIPAQETLSAAATVNPPFELSYWHYAMSVAQQWRERMGEKRNPQWDELIEKLSPLASNDDGLYLAAETAIDTYKDVRFTSDHMAVLGAYGILPLCKLVDEKIMKNTLDWVWDNWNWDKTWGWDYPMTAMNAARLGDTKKAVGALLMDKRTNTYLLNGHNYQDERLRIYLPGNGGLLTAVAMMCAGWDGCKEHNPGFPKNGKWDVRWEGLKPLP